MNYRALGLLVVLLTTVLVTPVGAQWWEPRPTRIQNLHLDVKPGEEGTLTIRNPGAGLGVYILAVDWSICGLRGLAGDTPVRWTTTNLRGLAWSGTIFTRREDWPNCYFYSSPSILRTWPVQSEAPGTVVTFRFPPTPNVAANLNVYFTYAPWFDDRATVQGRLK